MSNSKDLKKKMKATAKSGREALIQDMDKGVLSISPKMDMGLSGGIQEGSWVLIQGPKKVGKTVLTQNIIRSAIKEGRKVFYFFTEERVQTKNLAAFPDEILDSELFTVFTSEENNILSGEDILNIIIDLLKDSEKRV